MATKKNLTAGPGQRRLRIRPDSDGTFTWAVHQQDTDGVWHEIDHSKGHASHDAAHESARGQYPTKDWPVEAPPAS